MIVCACFINPFACVAVLRAQPGKAQPTSKEQKARAAAAGGKGRKKKWSKQRTKEKVNNAVLFEKVTPNHLIKTERS